VGEWQIMSDPDGLEWTTIDHEHTLHSSTVVHHGSSCLTSSQEGIGIVENFYSRSDKYKSRLFTRDNRNSLMITRDSLVITTYSDHS